MNNIPATKRCPACNIEKQASEFCPASKSPDGLAWRCRECYNEYVKAYRAARKEGRPSPLHRTKNDLHDGRTSRTYRIWAGMKTRCLNASDPHYKNYGARGIKVCARWMDFRNFFEDMGEAPKGCSIDRINNGGDYEPSNCRWATQLEQMQNTRRTIRITYNGETKTVRQWAQQTGLAYWAIMSRWQQGWTPEQIFTLPAYAHRPKAR